MFRRLQFTIPEGAIFISCVDQKLFTLQAIHNFSMVIPLLANQDLTPMLVIYITDQGCNTPGMDLTVLLGGSSPTISQTPDFHLSFPKFYTLSKNHNLHFHTYSQTEWIHLLRVYHFTPYLHFGQHLTQKHFSPGTNDSKTQHKICNSQRAGFLLQVFHNAEMTFSESIKAGFLLNQRTDSAEAARVCACVAGSNVDSPRQNFKLFELSVGR